MPLPRSLARDGPRSGCARAAATLVPAAGVTAADTAAAVAAAMTESGAPDDSAPRLVRSCGAALPATVASRSSEEAGVAGGAPPAVEAAGAGEGAYEVALSGVAAAGTRRRSAASNVAGGARDGRPPGGARSDEARRSDGASGARPIVTRRKRLWRSSKRLLLACTRASGAGDALSPSMPNPPSLSSDSASGARGRCTGAAAAVPLPLRLVTRLSSAGTATSSPAATLTSSAPTTDPAVLDIGVDVLATLSTPALADDVERARATRCLLRGRRRRGAGGSAGSNTGRPSCVALRTGLDERSSSSSSGREGAGACGCADFSATGSGSGASGKTSQSS